MLKTILVAVSVLAVAILTAFAFGPREPADLTVAIDRDAIQADPAAFLQASEANVPNIRPGMEKEIVYAFPNSRAKTPLAIVYLHGFSATKNELRPVPDRVATRLGANLYYARLAGHGQDGAAMGRATVNDWVNDLAEALTVAEELGERTIVIGTSTGATLAALAATEPGLRKQVDAIVQVSPNYALKNRAARVLDLPFAETIVRWVEGKERSFEPVNDLHAQNWTSRYPSRAVLPMAALTREVRSRTFENITIPTLFVFDEDDTVVDHAVTRRVAARWGQATGAGVHIELMHGTDDPYRHVIAGDSLSPSTTAVAVDLIVGWIEELDAPASS